MWGRDSFEPTRPPEGRSSLVPLRWCTDRGFNGPARGTVVGTRCGLRNAGPFNTNTALDADVFAEAYTVQIPVQHFFS